MNVREATKFINKLKRDYPIQGIGITVELCPAGIVQGSDRLHGVVQKQGNTANIYVDSSRSESLVYMALAHEYRHVMQWMIKDLEWRGDKETDANIFGNKFAKNYMGFPGAC